MAELTSRQIGKYQIQAELGRGGFGSVYRAYDPTVGRLVAIKILTASADQQLLTRFKNEAAAAGNLRHKNIITIYDFGDHEGMPYIVMEFLEGEDLQQVISRNQPLPLLDKVSIMLQVADGLHCAHRSGVVHRDVKPGNIRILPDGTVKIMDFGIARVMAAGGGAARLTRQGYVIGTLLYMAPEQVRGGEVDFLCDIFAYGITYYELLAGKHPFQGSDPRTVFYRITTEEAEPIRNIVPECPEALELIINRTLHKERELRYQSLREVQLDTEPLLMELRQERAGALLDEAARLYTGGQIDSAQAVLNEAFDLDPGNRGARQLRETIQQQLLRRVIEPKIRALLERGESQLVERRFQDAIETLEAALRLDRENAAVLERLNRARELLKLSRESARLVAEAKRELSRNNLEGVLQALPQTLELDPGNPEARQLLDEVRSELARRDRQRERDRRLEQAKEMLSANRFDDALRQLDEVDGDGGAADDVRRLADEVRTKKQAHERQQRLQEELGAARELLAAGQHDRAIRRLERLMSAYPEEPEATRLFITAHKKLAAQRKAETIDKLGVELVTLLEHRLFERARELVEHALRDYPAEQRLLAALREIEAEQEAFRKSECVREALELAQRLQVDGELEAAEQSLRSVLRDFPAEERLVEALSGVRFQLERKRRDDAIEQVCREAGSRAQRREFEAALADIDGCADAHGADPRLDAARESVVGAKAQWERAEAIRQALDGAEQRLASDDPEQAVEALESALGLYPGDERLTAGLSGARAALQAKQREQGISAVAADVRSKAARRDFDSALIAIDDALASFGRDDRLAGAREGILQAKAAWERSETIRLALESAAQALERDDPEHAVATLESALQEHAGETRLMAALADAQAAVEAKRREAAIDSSCREARSLLDACDFDRALDELDRTIVALGPERRLTEAREEALAARSDWQRRETIRQALEAARRHLAADEPAGALQVLEAALESLPGEEQLAAAAAEARMALEAHRRERAIQEALADASSYRETQQFDRALDALAEAERVNGADRRLGDLREEVSRTKAAWDRSECVRHALQESGQGLSDGDPEAAIAVLDAAIHRYPDEEQLLEAVTAAREALDTLRREMAVNTALRVAAERLERLEFDPALDEVERALQTVGPDERLTALKTRIVADRLKWHRAETTRIALEESRNCLTQDSPSNAVEILASALERYPGEPQLEEALTVARERLGHQRREIDIEAALQEAESRLAGAHFDSALESLAGALEMHGPDDRLTALRDRVSEAKAAQERENAIQRSIAEFDSCLAEGDPEAALESLQPVLECYADDGRLAAAAASAREAIEEKRRDAAIDAVCSAAALAAEGHDFDAAFAVLARGIAAHGPEARFDALRANLASRRAEWQRSECVRLALEESRRRMAKDGPEGALEALEPALQEFPDDAELAAAASTARLAVEGKRRAAAVEKLDKQVRRSLKKHDFESTLAAIQDALREYPDDPTLLQLHRKTTAAKEEREREQAIRSALSHAAKLQAEDHFAEALAALKEALNGYPGEPRLVTAYSEIDADFRRRKGEESLAATLDEARRLTPDDPDRAVELLERALAEHPGDELVAAALEQARESQAARRRDASIDNFCRDTRLFLESREFDPALQTLERGLQLFGEEQRLAQLRETVLASKADWERAEGIRQVVEEADRHAAEGRLETAVESLVAATRIYGPEDRLTEAIAVTREAIEKQRRSEALEQFCREIQAAADAEQLDDASRLLDEAEQQHGTAPELQALRTRIVADRERLQRAEAIRRIVDDANGLLDRAEPDRALAVLDDALRRYAGEQSLRAFRSRALQLSQAKKREQAVERACSEIEAAVHRRDFAGALKLLNRAEKGHGPEDRFAQLRADIAAAKATAQERPPQPPSRSAPLPPPARARNPRTFLVAAGIFIVVGAGAAMLLTTSGKQSGTARIVVQASPSTASVKIDDQSCTKGDCAFDLKPGPYRIQVSADGYESKTEETSVAVGDSAKTITVALKPLAPLLQVNANFAQAEITVDGASRGHLQDGQFVWDDLAPGKHEFRLSGPEGQAAFSFQAEFAKLPSFGEISSNGIDAIAVGTFGNQAAVSCAGCSGRVMVDDRSIGDLKEGQITLNALAAGTHQLRLNSQSGERKVVFTAGGTPAIHLSVTSGRNYGTLVVDTGEDGVTVFVDDRRQSRRTSRGQLRLPVEAREHTIRVAKDGYRAEPAEFRGIVAKGDQLQARFRMSMEPARLLLTDALPGASVKIDGKAAGVVAANGSFSASVAAGDRQIELTREGFAPVSVRRSFRPGGSTNLGKAEIHMAAIPVAGAAARASNPPLAEPPPTPDPAAIEAAEWQRIARNPNSAEVAGFLQKFPSGSNAREAQRVLEQLDWNGANKASKPALQAFLAKHPSGAFAQQALAELGRIDRELAAQQQHQQEAERLRQEREEVRMVLRAYAEAFTRKDAKQVADHWPSMPAKDLRDIRASFRDFQSIKLELRPLGEPEIKGTSARVQCQRLTDAVDRSGSHPTEGTVTILFEKRNGRWVIDSIR